MLGLVLIAPVLAGSLDQATERSTLAGTAAVLDARVPVKDKVRIALAVRDEPAAGPVVSCRTWSARSRERRSTTRWPRRRSAGCSRTG